MGKDNALQDIDLGLVNSSAAGTLAELYVNRLRERDEITDGVGANKLIKAWPPANKEWTTKAVRDAFFSSPSLPRLLNPNAIRRTIADGVNQKLIAYAGKSAAASMTRSSSSRTPDWTRPMSSYPTISSS